MQAFRVEYRTPPGNPRVDKKYQSLICNVRVSSIDSEGNKTAIRKNDYMVRLNQCGDHGTACEIADTLRYNVQLRTQVVAGEEASVKIFVAIQDNQTLPCNVLLTYVLDENVVYCAVEQKIVKAWQLKNPKLVWQVQNKQAYKFDSTEEANNPNIGKMLYEAYPGTEKYWITKPGKKCSAN
jgi:hypothetical protein